MKVNEVLVSASYYDRAKLKRDNILNHSSITNSTSDISSVIDIVDIKRSVETANYKVGYVFNQYNKKVLVDITDKETGLIQRISSENIPHSFQKINNEKVFNAFLDSTYTKVTCLSDGDYKIYTYVKGIGGGRGYRAVEEKKDEVKLGLMNRAANKFGIDYVSAEEYEEMDNAADNKLDTLGSSILDYTARSLINWAAPHVLTAVGHILGIAWGAIQAAFSSCEIY